MNVGFEVGDLVVINSWYPDGWQGPHLLLSNVATLLVADNEGPPPVLLVEYLRFTVLTFDGKIQLFEILKENLRGAAC